MNKFITIFQNFKGDAFGGITAGIIALPLALAFGVASGIGATAGLYGAILVGFFASLFGGTKTQISGPTGPITVVIASIIATNPGNFELIFSIIILAGLFQVLFGILKIGQFVKYVPYPVISGFMSGIGAIIIILQINPILGEEPQNGIINSIMSIKNSFSNLNIESFTLGLLTLIIVFFTPNKIKQKIPPALIALVVVTIISLLLKYDIKTIGNIPMGFPNIKFPVISLQELSTITPLALTLAILGTVDSLLTSLVADSLTKDKHDSNKELVGQGIGNIFAGLFGGLAGAGATMRTVINIKSGGKTKTSGIIHSLFLMIILLGAAPLVKNIPMAVLAGILIKVGFDIIDYKFLKILRDAPKYDLIVMITVFLITIFYDLIFAVGVGIVLSSVLLTISLSKQTKINIKNIVNKNNNEEKIERDSNYHIRIINIDGVFFFGSTSRILMRVDELIGTQYVILNCKNIPDMDISAFFALEDIIQRLNDENIETFIVVKNTKVSEKLLNLGITKLINKNNILFHTDVAIKKAKKHYNNLLKN